MNTSLMSKLSSFLLLILFLASCEVKTPVVEPEAIVPPALTSEKILLENSFLIPLFNDLAINYQQDLLDIYSQRDFQNLFYDSLGNLSVSGQKLKEIISNSLYYGLPQSRIYLDQSPVDSISPELNLFIEDVQLSVGILRFFDDLQNGFSDSLQLSFRRLDLSTTSLLDSISLQDESYIDTLFKRYQPPTEEYILVLNTLQTHLDTADLSIQLNEVPLTKADTIGSYESAKWNIQLLQKDHFDSTLSKKQLLKNFQKANQLYPDGIVGKNTQIALQETPLEKAYRMAWALEKMRYQKEYPKQYIKVNLPEFKLYYFNEDTVVSIHNVVIGKFEHMTPVLEAKIYGIQTFPYWNVPYSIATKEILPIVRSNIRYLADNQMEILRKDEVVDPNKINWSRLNKKNFPYKIRQLPGEKNSLGIIKLEFYNKYDVYIHDTPSKYLFPRADRTFSHGCIRCQDPIDLAKNILEIDKKNKITIDSLDTLLANETQQLIRLKERLPIYIEYNTVAVSPFLVKESKRKNQSNEYENRVVISWDIYEKDQVFIRYFFETEKPKE